MIQLTNNKISLNKSRTLTTRQLARYKSLSEGEQKNYLLSCLGLSRKRVVVPKYSTAKTEYVSGRFLSLLRQAKNNGHAVDHKPLARGDWRGVEIECVIPRAESEECEVCCGSGARSETNDDGDETGHEIPCDECHGRGRIGDNDNDNDNLYDRIRQALTYNKIYRASVRSDGSVSGDDATGVEITLLINIAGDGYATLEKLCHVLKSEFNAKVNTTCGLHVHFDFSKKTRGDVALAAKRARKFLPVLALLVPSSRRNNTFCQLSVSKFNGSRYHAINLTSFHKHGSIEVRLHSGTLDADKIKNWIKLMGLIFTTPVVGRVNDLQDVLDKLPVNDELASYLDERFQKFNPIVAPVERVAIAPVPVPTAPADSAALAMPTAPVLDVASGYAGQTVIDVDSDGVAWLVPLNSDGTRMESARVRQSA